MASCDLHHPGPTRIVATLAGKVQGNIQWRIDGLPTPARLSRRGSGMPLTQLKRIPANESQQRKTGKSIMSPVLRIKAELFLSAAAKILTTQNSISPAETLAVRHRDTVAVVRKEIAKLVQILADDASDKHFNVAARAAKCADYLSRIPYESVQEARDLMVAAHRVLQDVEEIIL
jgi:hypothetical protein